MIQSWTPTVVDNVDYPASDGQPVGETPRHINNLFYVTYTLGQWFASNPSVFVAGNMFVYYERGNNRRHVSPDVFVSLDIPKETVPPRERYLLWEEGKGLDTVIEFTSPSTADEDLTTKRGIYRDILQVREYFLFDPTGDTLTPPLQGLRLVEGAYQPIEPVEGRLPSAVLGLHLEADGDLLRLWNPLTGDWLPIPPETSQIIQESKTAQQEAVTARQQMAAEYALEQEARRQIEVALIAERAAKEQAQALRIQEEQARKKEERARKKAERARKKEERARKQEERARKKEEEARKQAEEARKQAEEARKQAEEGLRHKDAELEQLKREIEELRRGKQKEQ
jgi:Uma2 family endonuclease